MSTDRVKLSSFPQPEARPRKRVWLPLVGVVVFGALLLWTADHVAGNCTEFQDAFRYCPLNID